MEEVLYLKFPPQKSFYALADCGPKFLIEPIFPFKIVGSHWPTPIASSHLGKPFSGWKGGANEGLVNFFSNYA